MIPYPHHCLITCTVPMCQIYYLNIKIFSPRYGEFNSTLMRKNLPLNIIFIVLFSLLGNIQTLLGNIQSCLSQKVG